MTNDDSTEDKNPEEFLPGNPRGVTELCIRFLLERHSGASVPVVDKTYLKSIILNGEHLTWLPTDMFVPKCTGVGANEGFKLCFLPFDYLSAADIAEVTKTRTTLELMPTMTIDTLNRLVLVVQELRERGQGQDKWWLKSVAGLLRKNGIQNIPDYTLKNGYYKSRVFKEALAFERYRTNANLRFDTSKFEVELRGRMLTSIAESTVAGLGLFAKRRLEKSLLVCCYSGTVISTEEARRLLSRGNDSILDLPSLNCAINGTPGSRNLFVGRYINHAASASKDHNLIAELTTYTKLSTYVPDGSATLPRLPPLTEADLSDKSQITVAFFAKHEIGTGEELFWDYVEGLEPYGSTR